MAGSIGRLVGLSSISRSTYSISGKGVTNIAKGQLIYNHDGIKGLDLEKSFRNLCLSPVEARLTAEIQSSCNKQICTPFHINEYKLPSIYKPISITVPSLHDRAILEKELPPIPKQTEIINPVIINKIEEAPSDQIVEKQAARLIVIRRRKMKKHKLKKLRKKMKFTWLKIIQTKEFAKEQAFQNEQMAIVKEAEAFDAKKYVEDILKRVNTKPDTRYFKKRRLPAFVVKECWKEENIKRQKKAQHVIAIAEMKEELRRKGILKD